MARSIILGERKVELRSPYFEAFPHEIIVDDTKNSRYFPELDMADDNPQLQRLADSIYRLGQQDAVKLIPLEDGRVRLHEGYRRLRARVIANRRLETEGRKPLPLLCVLNAAKDTDNGLTHLLQDIASNEERQNLSVRDKALNAKALKEEYGLTNAKIAQEFHNDRGEPVSEATIIQWLKVATLPQEVQKKLHLKEITLEHALLLIKAREAQPSADLEEMIEEATIAPTPAQLLESVPAQASSPAPENAPAPTNGNGQKKRKQAKTNVDTGKLREIVRRKTGAKIAGVGLADLRREVEDAADEEENTRVSAILEALLGFLRGEEPIDNIVTMLKEDLVPATLPVRKTVARAK